MNLEIVHINLKRLRSQRNVSQVALAERAGLSRKGYLEIENGKVLPRVASLQAISTALNVSIDKFFVPVRELKTVRFRATKKMKFRNKVLDEVSRWLDDYVYLENILDRKRRFCFDDLEIGLRSTDAIKAANQVRRLCGLGKTDYIRDICGLLGNNGVKVFTPSIESDGFFGLSVSEPDGGPAVVVNRSTRLSTERWIFTAAHELGHLIMHKEAFKVADWEENRAEETEADAFAAQFLMPDYQFDELWQQERGLGFVERIFKIKCIFGVSWKTVLYRLDKNRPGGNVWARFHWAYTKMTGKSLKGTAEPGWNVVGPFRFACCKNT